MVNNLGGENKVSNINDYVRFFEEYGKENVKISNWIRRFNGIFEEISKLEKSLAKKDVLGKKSEDIDKEIFESLSRDLDAMKRFAGEIMDQIEKEVPAISEFLGRVSHDEIQTAKFSFDTIKTYNKDKSQVVYNLMSMIPSLAKDLKGVVEIPMHTMEDSAKYYDMFCKELMIVVNRSPTKGAMFESLGILLNYLIQYVGNATTLSQNDKNRFVGFVKGSNSKKIVANFLNSIGTANDIHNKFTTLLSSNSIELSSSAGDGGTYNSLDKKKQGKVDEFTKSTLNILFSSFTGKDKKILKIINDDIFGEDEKKKDSEDDDIKELITKVKTQFRIFSANAHSVDSYPSISVISNEITQAGLTAGKAGFKNFFELLFSNDKSNIVEKEGKYSCEIFENIIEKILKKPDETLLSDFLNFTFDNFDILKKNDPDLTYVKTFLEKLNNVIDLTNFGS